MRARGEQLASLTSLRFLAALAVAFYHIPFVLPGVSTKPILPSGALGVSFFFVLSGFILSHVYPPDRAFGVARFYLRRFARIYPLHLLTFGAWTILFFAAWGNSLPDKMNSGIANILLLQAFFSGDLYNLGFNAVSWSLSAEAFFYLIFPLLRRPAAAGAWVALHVAIALALPAPIFDAACKAFPSFFYFNPFARAAEFALGILAYQVFCRLRTLPFATAFEVAGLAIMAFAVLQVQQRLPYLLVSPVLGGIFAMVIIIIGMQRGLVARYLSHPWFVLLGEASFAFYMIHHMGFRLIQKWLGPHLAGYPLLIVALALITAASIAIHLGFELPARKWLVGWVVTERQTPQTESTPVTVT